jgi:hypothetical protein
MSVALSISDRQLLVASAPEGLGDHVVSFAEGTIFALVRKDKTTPGGRIVALARSPEELQLKLCPPATELPAARKSSGSPWRRQQPAASGTQTTEAQQQRAAQAEMQSELAEYRRACAAAGVTTPKLI